jgi:hypothetical protein
MTKLRCSSLVETSVPRASTTLGCSTAKHLAAVSRPRPRAEMPRRSCRRSLRTTLLCELLGRSRHRFPPLSGRRAAPAVPSPPGYDRTEPLCIVHLIRNSLSFCNWKQRQPVARELKHMYEAETAELAAKRLEDFAEGPLGKKLPAIVQSWEGTFPAMRPPPNSFTSSYATLLKSGKNRPLPGNWQPANLRSNLDLFELGLRRQFGLTNPIKPGR